MPDTTSNATAQLLEQVVRQASRPYDANAIGLAEWSVLRRVGRPGEAGKTTTKIAAFLGAEEDVVERIVVSLAEKNLVIARASKDAQLALSSDGLGLLATDPVHRLTLALDRVSLPERVSLARHLENVSERLDEFDAS